MIESKFNFWAPVEISKAIDPNTGSEIMRLGGIASTIDEDSDGEFLDPKGFDIDPLLSKGVVNWHHQAKGAPKTIIGEPSKAELRKDGLYIETDLYPSNPIARDVYDLAQILEKDSKTRRLGYSIEGKVIKRKSEDKKSPDYNKILKAVITGVAITHQPKNPKTFANIIKGEVDLDSEESETEEEFEKENSGLNTDSGRALIKESVDKKLKKVVTLSKSEVLEKLQKDVPSINIEKAEKIYILLTKIADMKNQKEITEDDIQKAYEVLGLNQDVDEDTTDLNKAEEQPEEEEEETKKEETQEEEEESEVKVEKSETEEDLKSGSKGSNRFDDIEKAIAFSHNQQKDFIRSVGILLQKSIDTQKESSFMQEKLIDLVKAQEETISELSEKIEEFGSSTPAPKSLRNSHPVERFNKGSESEEFGRSTKVLSISRDYSKVADLLDTATFNKGFDEEFSKACTHFESSKTLPSNIIARVKNELGYTLVN